MSDTFEIDVEKWCKKAGDRADKFMRRFIQDVGEALVNATPVDTGFLRASWTVNIGAISESLQNKPSGGTSYPASASLAQLSVGALRSKASDTVYIVNRASYAAYVEYGTAYISPRAFVRKTVARAPAIAENAMRVVMAGGK